jgi:hypothetical protein
MNGASGAAPQQGNAAPDRAPDFIILTHLF